MTTTQKIIGSIVLVIALVIIGTVTFSTKGSVTKLGAQVQNDLFYFTGTPIAIDATGITYAQGGLVEGGVSTISPLVGTATTTLTFAQINNGTTIIVNVASSTVQNLVIPGTSTLSVATGFLPNIGDTETDLIDSASTTAAGLSLSAGAGVTIEKTTASTSGSVAVAAGGTARITFYRDTLNSLIATLELFK